MNGGSTCTHEIFSLLTTCIHFSIFYCSNHLQPYPTFYIMKNLLHDTGAFLIMLIFYSTLFMIAFSSLTYTIGERQTVVMCVEKPAQCKIIYDYLKMGDDK